LQGVWNSCGKRRTTRLAVWSFSCHSCFKLNIYLSYNNTKCALMFKLYFYTPFVITPTCFDLSWSSSRSDLTSVKKGKGKAIPLQAWTGPEGVRRLKLPDFKTIGTWRW